MITATTNAALMTAGVLSLGLTVMLLNEWIGTKIEDREDRKQ